MKLCVNSETNMFKFSVDKLEDFVHSVEHDMKFLSNSLDINPLMDINYKKIRPTYLLEG
jgi:hypothetical protein